MSAHVRHEHRCPCGAIWICQRPDCAPDDFCARCEDEVRAEYLCVRLHDTDPEIPPQPAGAARER